MATGRRGQAGREKKSNKLRVNPAVHHRRDAYSPRFSTQYRAASSAGHGGVAAEASRGAGSCRALPRPPLTGRERASSQYRPHAVSLLAEWKSCQPSGRLYLRAPAERHCGRVRLPSGGHRGTLHGWSFQVSSMALREKNLTRNLTTLQPSSLTIRFLCLFCLVTVF